MEEVKLGRVRIGTEAILFATCAAARRHPIVRCLGQPDQWHAVARGAALAVQLLHRTGDSSESRQQLTDQTELLLVWRTATCKIPGLAIEPIVPAAELKLRASQACFVLLQGKILNITIRQNLFSQPASQPSIQPSIQPASQPASGAKPASQLASQLVVPCSASPPARLPACSPKPASRLLVPTSAKASCGTSIVQRAAGDFRLRAQFRSPRFGPRSRLQELNPETSQRAVETARRTTRPSRRCRGLGGLCEKYFSTSHGWRSQQCIKPRATSK